VFVYAAEFADASLHEREAFVGREDDGTESDVVWVEMQNRKVSDPPVYPEGLRDLIYQ
jgi:hypothetical protein